MMKFEFDVVDGKEASKVLRELVGKDLRVFDVRKNGPAAGNDLITIGVLENNVELKLELLKSFMDEDEMSNEEFFELYRK